MNLHANARTTPKTRLLLCQRVLKEGWSVSAAAEGLGISRATAYKWLWRYEEEGAGARMLVIPPLPVVLEHDRVHVLEPVRTTRFDGFTHISQCHWNLRRNRRCGVCS